jgi:hypothetical protein
VSGKKEQRKLYGIFDFDRDPHPLARNEDPVESYAGAQDAESRLSELRLQVLECVLRHPGKTCNEMAVAEKVRDPRLIGRRLNELEKLGYIIRGETRPCEITGRPAAPWLAVKPCPVPALMPGRVLVKKRGAE